MPTAYAGGGAGGLNWTSPSPTDSWNYFVDTYQEDSPTVQSKNAAREGIDYIPETSLTLGGNNPYSGALTGNIGASSGQSVGFNDLFVIFEGAGLDINTDSFDADSKSFFSSLGMDANALVIDMFGEYGNSLIDNGGSIDLASISDLNLNQDVSNHFTIATSTDPEERMQAAKANLLTEIDRQNEKRASLQLSKYYGFETSEVGTNIATGQSYDFGTYGEKLRALDADLEEAETALEDAMFTFMESDGYDNRFHLIDDRPFFIADESTGFEKSSPLYGKQIANPNEGQLVQEANLINDYIFTPVEVDNIDAQQIAEENKLFDIDEDSLLGTALSSGDKSTFTGRLIAAGLQAAGLSSSMKIYLTAQTWNTVVNTLNAGYNRIANDNIDLNINVNPFEFGAELLKRHFVNADGDPIITDEVEDDFFLNIAANIFSPEYAALNFAVNLIGGEDASFIADSDAPLFDINQSISDFVNSLTTAPVLSQVQKASDQGKFEGVDTTRGTGVRGFLDDVTRFINKGGVTLQKIFSPIISNSIVNGLGLNIEGQPAGEVFTAIGRLLSPKSLRDWARYLEGEGIDPNNIQDADISYYKKIVNDFLTSDKKLENGLTPWEERTNNISEGGYDAKLYTALSNFYKQETGKDFDTAQPLDLLAALQTVSNYNSTYSEADIRNADTAGYINALNNNYEQFANTSDLEIISDLAFGDSSVGTQETLNGVLDYRDYLNDLPSGQEALSFGEFFISAKEAEFSAGTIDLGLGIYYTPDDIEQIAENVVGIDVINDRGGYQSFSNGLVDLYEYNISDGITGDNSLSQYYINDLETTDPIALRATGTVEEGTYILPDLPTMGYRFDYMQSEADGSGLAYDPISGIAEVFDESRFIDNAGTKNDLYDFRELSADDLLLSNKKITRRRIDDLVKQGRLPLKELVEYVRTNPFEYLEMNAQEFKKSMISLGYATENTIFTFEGAVPEELQDLLLDNTFGSENLTVDGLPENSISPVNLVEAGLFSSLEQAENYLISLPNTVYQGFIYTNKIDGAQLINDPNYGKYLDGELPIPVRSYDYTSQPHITTAYTSQADAAVDRALRSNGNYFLEKIAGGRDDIESLKIANEIFGGYSGNQRFITDLKNLGYINDDFSINVANAEFFDPNYRETSDYRNAQYSTFTHNGEIYVADKNYMFAEVLDEDNFNSDGTYSFRDITKEYLTNYPLIYNPNTLRDAGLQTFGSTQVELFKQLYADGVVSYQDLIDSLGVIEQRQYTVDEDKRLETDPSGGIIGFVSDPANENEESPRNFPEELLDSNDDGIPNFMDEGYVSPTIYDTGEGQIDVSEFIEIPDFDVTIYENIEDLDAGFAEHINAIRDADLNYFREQELSELALLLKNQQERYLEQVGKDTFVDLGIFSVSEILTEQGVLDAYDARLELIRDPDSGLSANQITFEENIAAQIKNNQLAFLGVQQNLNNALQDKFVDLGIFSVIGIDSVEDLETAYELRVSQINDLDNGMTPNQRRAELERVEDIYNTKITHFQLVQDKKNLLDGVQNELTNLKNLGRTEDTDRIIELEEQVKAIQEYELPEFVVEDYTSSENPTRYLNDYLQNIEEARATGLISTYNAGLITENIGQFAINLDDLETITIARDDYKAKYEEADAEATSDFVNLGVFNVTANTRGKLDAELTERLNLINAAGLSEEQRQYETDLANAIFNAKVSEITTLGAKTNKIDTLTQQKNNFQTLYGSASTQVQNLQARIEKIEAYEIPEFNVTAYLNAEDSSAYMQNFVNEVTKGTTEEFGNFLSIENADQILSNVAALAKSETDLGIAETARDNNYQDYLTQVQNYNTAISERDNARQERDANALEIGRLEGQLYVELDNFKVTATDIQGAQGQLNDFNTEIDRMVTDGEITSEQGELEKSLATNSFNVYKATQDISALQTSSDTKIAGLRANLKTAQDSAASFKAEAEEFEGKYNTTKADLESNQAYQLPNFNTTAIIRDVFGFTEDAENDRWIAPEGFDGNTERFAWLDNFEKELRAGGILTDQQIANILPDVESALWARVNREMKNAQLVQIREQLSTAEGRIGELESYTLPDFTVEGVVAEDLDGTLSSYQTALDGDLNAGLINQEQYNTLYDTAFNLVEGQKDLNDAVSELEILATYELPDFNLNEAMSAMGYNYDVEANLWSEPEDREGDRGSWINEYMDNYKNVTLADSPLTEQQKTEVLDTVKQAISTKISKELWKNDRNYYYGKLEEAKAETEALQTTSDTEITRLNDLVVSANNEADRIQGLLDNAEIKVSDLEAEEIRLNNEIRELDSQVLTDSENYTALRNEKDRIKGLLDTARADRDAQRAAKESAREEASSLQLQLETAQAATEALQAFSLPEFNITATNQVELDAYLDGYQGYVDKAEADRNISAEQALNFDTIIASIRNNGSQIFTLEAANTDKQDEIDTLKTTNQGLSDTIGKKDDEILDLTGTISVIGSGFDVTLYDDIGDLDTGLASYIQGINDSDLDEEMKASQIAFAQSMADMRRENLFVPTYEAPDFNVVADGDLAGLNTSYEQAMFTLNSFLGNEYITQEEYNANVAALDESYNTRKETLIPAYELPEFTVSELDAEGGFTNLDAEKEEFLNELQGFLDNDYITREEHDAFEAQIESAYDTKKRDITPVYEAPDFTVYDTKLEPGEDFSAIDADYNTARDALDLNAQLGYITASEYIDELSTLESSYNEARKGIAPVYELPDFSVYGDLQEGDDFTEIDTAYQNELTRIDEYYNSGYLSTTEYYEALGNLETEYTTRKGSILPTYTMPDFGVTPATSLANLAEIEKAARDRFQMFSDQGYFPEDFDILTEQGNLESLFDAERARLQGTYTLPEFTVSDPTAVLTQDDVSNLFSEYEEGLRQDVLDKMLGLDDFFKAIDVAKPIFDTEFASRALPGALDDSVDYGIISDDNNEYDDSEEEFQGFVDDFNEYGGGIEPTFGGVDTDGILTGNYMAKLDPAYQLAEILLGQDAAREMYPTGKSKGLADEALQEIVNRFMLGQAEDAFNMQAGLSDRMQALNEQQTRTQRASDLRLLGEFGDSYRDQIAELYPDANQALTAQREISARSAERARGDLSPTEQAQLEQQSYLFGANRGREYDPVTLAQQIAEDTSIRDRRDTMASSQQTQLMNMEKGMYGDLMSIIGTDSPFTAGVGNIQTPFNIAGIMDLGTVDYANQQRREEAQMMVNQLERDYATARALNKPSEAKSILVQLNEANSILDNLVSLGSKTEQSMGTVRDIFSGFGSLFGLGSIKPDYDVSSDNDLGYYSVNRRR